MNCLRNDIEALNLKENGDPMELISKKAIEELMAVRSDGCVSLYMPTHRAGRGIQQDPIRLKNLLRKGLQELEATGMRPTLALDRLNPVHHLVEDSDFWQHQSDAPIREDSGKLVEINAVGVDVTEIVTELGEETLKRASN